MNTRTLSLIATQGDPDPTAPTAANGGVRPDRCDVTAIYTDGAGTRLELHITDWDEAQAIPQTVTVQG